MMTESLPFGDIEEVVETSRRDINAYLQAGYRVLAIQGVNEGAKFGVVEEGKPANRGDWYVRRRIVYVMGRPAGVEHFEPPARDRAGQPALAGAGTGSNGGAGPRP